MIYSNTIMKRRCAWLDNSKLDYIKYHDEDWGVQVHDDRKLFAKLILDGAQAGLSWYTILRKRDNYREAFDNWDYKKIAAYTSKKEQELLQNAGIVRNKLKIKSAIKNAKVFIEIQNEFGSFDKYIWAFVNNKQIVNKFKRMKDIPSTTELSDKISKDLKKRGMNFVGPTIIYAFMQAVGMVNDHQIDCFRYKEVQ
jgi:DNA-3-methyladenine glycosylase I